jgi:hypothetical protein
MDSKIKEIIFNIQKRLDENNKLSLTVIANYLYLIDWKHSIDFGYSITNIAWMIGYDNTPFSIDIKDLDLIQIEKFGDSKLSEIEVYTVNFVIKTIENKNEEEIKHLIISTYPFIIHGKGDEIDLKKCAEEYNKIRYNGFLKTKTHKAN